MTRKKPLIVGLTGSIGMGKSTVAKTFARLGAAVLCADQIVHDLLAPGGAAVRKVAKLCPESLVRDHIDRKKLGAAVFQAPQKLQSLEAILHPLVWKARNAFIKQARREGKEVVLLEIPLLFETGADALCDVTICVTAPSAIQKERVLKRKNMSPQKFRAILKQQMPDRDKRRRANIVLRTDLGLAQMRKDVKHIWATLGREPNDA